jgi:hypothetical protein
MLGTARFRVVAETFPRGRQVRPSSYDSGGNARGTATTIETESAHADQLKGLSDAAPLLDEVLVQWQRRGAPSLNA